MLASSAFHLHIANRFHVTSHAYRLATSRNHGIIAEPRGRKKSRPPMENHYFRLKRPALECNRGSFPAVHFCNCVESRRPRSYRFCGGNQGQFDVKFQGPCVTPIKISPLIIPNARLSKSAQLEMVFSKRLSVPPHSLSLSLSLSLFLFLFHPSSLSLPQSLIPPWHDSIPIQRHYNT